jgi:hypothetical protein
VSKPIRQSNIRTQVEQDLYDEAYFRRWRIENGIPSFNESILRRLVPWELTPTQREAVASLRLKNAGLADEIQLLWSQGRSYRRLAVISDRQISRIANGLQATGVEVWRQIELADEEFDTHYGICPATPESRPPTPTEQAAAMETLIRAILTSNKEPLTYELRTMLGSLPRDHGLKVARSLITFAQFAVADDEDWDSTMSSFDARSDKADVPHFLGAVN